MNESLSRTLTVGVAAIAAVAAVYAASVADKARNEAATMHKEFLDTAAQQRAARLVSSGFSFTPQGRPGFTNVAVRNEGDSQAIVESVSFTISKTEQTPNIPPPVAHIDAFDVVFKPTGIQLAERKLESRLPSPVGVPGREHMLFRVIVIDPKRVGTTCIGQLTVWYNDEQPCVVSNVVVDVLPGHPDEWEEEKAPVPKRGASD